MLQTHRVVYVWWKTTRHRAITAAMNADGELPVLTFIAGFAIKTLTDWLQHRQTVERDRHPLAHSWAVKRGIEATRNSYPLAIQQAVRYRPLVLKERSTARLHLGQLACRHNYACHVSHYGSWRIRGSDNFVS
jgi:hypothetical protein